MTDSGNRLPAGHVLDHYRIVSVLGQGGFGITYLADDENLQAPVAIKEYLPDGLARRDGDMEISIRGATSVELFNYGYDRFQFEAKILMSFRDSAGAPNGHPNVVCVLDTFEALGTAYMVMPYLDGETLEDRMRDQSGPGAADDLRDLLGGILDGLEAAHGRDLLHRDIKPGNIFVTNNGRPILIDFGAARFALTQKRQALTSIVTDGYSPQEQYDPDIGAQGPWTDFYALGATIYHFVMGTPPTPAPALADGEELRPITGVDPDIRDAVSWCLMQHPDDRPENVAALRAVFEGRETGAGPGSYTGPSTGSTIRGHRRDGLVKDLWQALQREDGRFSGLLKTFEAAFPAAQETPALRLLSRVDRYGTPNLDETEELVDGPWRAFLNAEPPEGPSGEYVCTLAALTSPDLAESAAYSISDPTVGTELEEAIGKMLAAIQLLRAEDVRAAAQQLKQAVKGLEKALAYSLDGAAGRRREGLLQPCLNRCQQALALLE